MVDPSEAQHSEPSTLKMTETFVNIPPSLKDLGQPRESEAREEKKVCYEFSQKKTDRPRGK